MSQADPEKITKEAPAPQAPKLGELLELSLTALVGAPGVFLRLAERPAPSPGASTVAALAWGAVFFTLNLVHLGLSQPALLKAYPEWMIGVVFLCGLGAWTALFLLGSSLVYGLGRALGAGGDFDRALLVTSVALVAAPVQALCSFFPMAWALPALLAAWILAAGISSQFKTDPWAARGVCAALAAGVLGAQYGVGVLVERYAGPARLAAFAVSGAPSPEQLSDLQKQMEQIQAAAHQAQASAQTAASSTATGRSGLDLLSGPGATEKAASAPTQLEQLASMSASGDAMNKSIIAMLSSMEPMLNNPVITQNMTLQQKSEFAELKQTLATMKAEMAAGTITSPHEQQAKMMRIQRLVMRMMSASMTMPKAAVPEAKK